jgi:tetratricopeptide (TPR) repeat protein
MAIDKTERHNRVREALGRLYEQQPPYFREYLRRFQEDPTSRVFAPLAEAYRRLGRIDDAIEICREGLGHHPDFHGGRVALAKCYIDKKLFGEARAELERVVQSVPENLLAQRLLGDVYLALRDSVSALHCYKMALLLSPTDVALAEKVHLLERNEQVMISHGDTLEFSRPSGQPREPLVPLRDDGDEPDPGRGMTGDIPPLWNSPEMGRPLADAGDLNVDSGTNTATIGIDFEKALSETLADQLPGTLPPPAAESADDPGEAIENFLGDTAVDDEAFKIEHVSAIFGDETPKKEITTETLGDLYYSQGQFDRALRIFEKLRPSPEIARKIDQCRMRLGVDQETAIRNRKIAALRAVLKRIQSQAAR